MYKKSKYKNWVRLLGLLVIIALAVVYFTPNFMQNFPFKKRVQQWQHPVAVKGKIIKFFEFNQNDAFKGWQEKVFKNKVNFKIESENGNSFLRASSKKACSGYFYRLGFSARQYPFISWKWRVIKFPEKSEKDLSSDWVEKDDYAARVYVIFPSLFFSRTQCLEYVWDKSLPAGKILTSPYFKNIKIIVAESGSANLNNWVFVERNIREDYKKAFGREPGSVGAVAIMTDSDNSQSSAEADFDEMRVGYNK